MNSAFGIRVSAVCRYGSSSIQFAGWRANVRGAILFLVVVGLAFCSTASYAAEGHLGNRAALLRALASKDRALDSGNADDWKRTLALLQEADALQSGAVTKYEIAFAAAQLGQTDLALENFAYALRLGLPEKAAVLASEFLAEHIRQVAQLRLEGPEGTLILVRGMERAKLPCPEYVYATPGLLTLDAVFPDGSRTTRELTTEAGQIVSIAVKPDELESSPPQSSSSDVVSAPALEAATPAPIAEVSSPPGSRKNPGTLVNERRNSGDNRVAWAMLAAGATATALSAAFMPVAYSRVSSSRGALFAACDVQINGPDTCAHAKQGRWQEAQSASDSIATWKMARTVSWVGLVTGLVTTIGSTALVLRSHPQSSTTALQISLGGEQAQVLYVGQLW